jgi:Golgi nucleoside diphosphatase
MDYTPDFAGDRYVIPIHTLMRGSGSFEECQDLVQQLLNKRASCWVRECTFDGVYQPRLNNREFIGISTFSRIVDDLGLPLNDTAPFDIKQSGKVVCSTQYNLMSAKYPSVKLPNRDYLCFTAVYVHTLLTLGLGFSEKSKQIQFYKSEKNHPERIVDWALGAAVWDMNRIPPGGITDFLAKLKNKDSRDSFGLLA